MLIFDDFQKKFICLYEFAHNFSTSSNFWPGPLVFWLTKDQFTRKNYFERNIKHRCTQHIMILPDFLVERTLGDFRFLSG
jgi:hypothetical protein